MCVRKRAEDQVWGAGRKRGREVMVVVVVCWQQRTVKACVSDAFFGGERAREEPGEPEIGERENQAPALVEGVPILVIARCKLALAGASCCSCCRQMRGAGKGDHAATRL